MARLYGNENFPLPVVHELRRLGHDVSTATEAGRTGQAWPDQTVLDFAVAEGRAVLTLNRKHFVRLHSIQPEHAGIVVCVVDPDFVGQAAGIHAAIAGQQDLSGQLLRVNRPPR